MKNPGLIILLVCYLEACGYPGEPRPPALNRPIPVTDLSANQHADKIQIRFTTPKQTTEDLPLKATPDVELRIGPLPTGRFDIAEWQRNTERIPVVTPGKADVDAAKYTGKTEVIGIKVHGPHGQDAGWSNLQIITPVPALPTPQGLEARDINDGIRLDWHAAAPQFRIFRKSPTETDWTQLATPNKPPFDDNTIEYGKTYQYQVQSIEKSGDRYAESEMSESISVKPADRFAPAIPAGLTAVPGTRTIELVWERNAEKDFASYRIFRDGKRVAENVTSPAYSDKDVKPGVKYQYRISAVDSAGNESGQSAPVEAAIP